MPIMNPNLLMPQFGDVDPVYNPGPTLSGNMDNPFAMNAALEQPMPQPHAVQEVDPVMDMVNKLYTPGHEVSDRFNQVWSEMPQREKPGILRKIVASMVGFSGGPKAADEVISGPYNRQMEDWTTKLRTLQPLLTDERYENVNNRQLATNAATQQTAANRLAIQQRDVDSKIADREARAEMANKVYELKRQIESDPNYKLQTDQATGKVYAIDLKHPDAAPIDTGTTFDNFSEMDKAKYRLREAAVPRTVNTIGQTTSTTTPDTTLPPTQEKVRQYNNAQEAFNTHPEWRKWISLADPGTNEFEIAEPGQVRDWWPDKNGPDQKTFDEINNFIKTNAAPGTGTPKTTTSTRQSTSTSQKGGRFQVAPPKAIELAASPRPTSSKSEDVKAWLIAKGKLANDQTIAAVQKQMGGK